MWLYIPRGYCLSSQESVDSIARYGLFFQNVELFVTSSGKPTPRPYSWQGWKTRPWMKLLYGVTLQPSTVKASMDSWTQSLSVSPVPTSQLLENRKESRGENKAQDQDSSLKPAELFAKYDQGTFLSKTSQDSFLTDSCQSYSESFPKWGSMHNGECFRQEMWVAPILEKESSSWATPNTMDHLPQRSPEALSKRANGVRKGRRRPGNLREQVDPEAVRIYEESSSWPTPRKSEPEGGVVENTKFENGSFSRVNQQGVRFGVKLKDAVSAWPTPNASRSGAMKGDNPRGKHAGNPLKTASESWPTPCSTEVRQGYQDRSRGKKGSQESLTTVVLKGQQCNNPTGPLAQEKQKNGNESSKSVPTSPQPLKKRLNPNFVEWLMGVPVGWSLPTPIDQNAYKRWETESLFLLEQLH